VLIRKLYPIYGIEHMEKYRNVKIGKNYKNLIDGPSKLCIGFKITKEEFNGSDSTISDSKLFFTQGEDVVKEKIIINKRIGIDYAEEDKNKLLRFSIKV
jgi:DNA-3-methyladenine glycosylase